MSEKFCRPLLNEYPITQRFGENPADYKYTNGHPGVDFATPIGTVCVATKPGKIIRADFHKNNDGTPGYGNHIRLLVENNETVIYGHLNGYITSAGKEVNLGEPICWTGNSGRSTGPHLHYELRNAKGVPIDPEPFFGVAQEVIAPANIRFSHGQEVVVAKEALPYLNVRSRPSRDAFDIGDIFPETKVIVDEVSGEWVRIYKAGTFECWVHGAWLRQI